MVNGIKDRENGGNITIWGGGGGGITKTGEINQRAQLPGIRLWVYQGVGLMHFCKPYYARNHTESLCFVKRSLSIDVGKNISICNYHNLTSFDCT